jgi:hypothetical protein
MTPIIVTPEEFGKQIEARKNGQTHTPKQVTETPAKLKQWITKNAQRITAATERGTLSYWLKNNANFADIYVKEVRKSLFGMYKKFKTGGKIEIIDGYKKKNDHNDLVSIARLFAQKGNEVKITTDIHFKGVAAN